MNYQVGKVYTYETNSNGDPVLATRRTLVSGLTNAEGAALDPATGDFLFSTFGNGSEVYRVSGFSAAAPVPEPPAYLLLALGAAGVLAGRKRRIHLA